MVLDEEYYKKLNESEQRFYGIINEIRIQMGMPTVEVPFYGPKESDATVECNQELSAPGSAVAEEEEITGEHSCGLGLEHFGDDGNTDLEAKPAKSEVNSGPGATVQQRDSLELPSTEIRAQKGRFPLEVTFPKSFQLNTEHFPDMADGTRMKTMEENLKKLEAQLLQQVTSYESTESKPTLLPPEIPQSSVMEEDTKVVSNLDDNPKDLKVNFDFLEVVGGHVDCVSKMDVVFSDSSGLMGIDAVVVVPIESIGIKWADLNRKSSDFPEIGSAHKVLEEMSQNDIVLIGSYFPLKEQIPKPLLVPDVVNLLELLGILGNSLRSIDSPSFFVFDPGKKFEFEVQWMSVEVRSAVEMDELGYREELLFFVFDPGITEWVY